MTFGEKKLKLNQDYTVKYDLNDEPGTAVAYVNGLGEYVGFKMLFFTIKEEGVKNIDISKAKVSVSGDAVRNGKKVNMPEVNLELNGKRLNPDKDFYVNCMSHCDHLLYPVGGHNRYMILSSDMMNNLFNILIGCLRLFGIHNMDIMILLDLLTATIPSRTRCRTAW